MRNVFLELSLRKRSHNKDPAKTKNYDEAQRKSFRLHKESPSASSIIQTQICNTEYEHGGKEETVDSSIPVQTTRHTKRKSTIRDVWEVEGHKLFDVRSEKKVKKCIKEGFCFDLTFYEDQKDQITLRMVLTKMTKEFIEEDLRCKKREAISECNRLSALGHSQTDTEDDTDAFDKNAINVDEDQDIVDIDTGNSSISDSLNSSVHTRSKTGHHISDTSNAQTQTDSTLPLPMPV